MELTNTLFEGNGRFMLVELANPGYCPVCQEWSRQMVNFLPENRAVDRPIVVCCQDCATEEEGS